MNHARRGQVLPMWAAGIITTLALMFLAMNYANSIRWQIRAQNAADSAAQSIASIQAERWNAMEAALYATNVEEFRLRSLLDATMLSVDRSGGCSMSVYLWLDASVAPGTCMRNYLDLVPEYTRSANRYSIDVKYLNDSTALSTYANWLKDANVTLKAIATSGTCNNSYATSTTVVNGGGDCRFKYTLNSAQWRTGLQTVESDAQVILIPGFHYATNVGTDSEYPQLWAPVKVDVVTCTIVNPIIPSFGPFRFRPYYAIGRAAATNIQVSQDWMQPGSVVRTSTGKPFQPYESDPDVVGAGQHDFYTPDYGGNTTTAYLTPSISEFDAPIQSNELGAHLGWWAAIPIQPFGPAVGVTAACT